MIHDCKKCSDPKVCAIASQFACDMLSNLMKIILSGVDRIELLEEMKEEQEQLKKNQRKAEEEILRRATIKGFVEALKGEEGNA